MRISELFERKKRSKKTRGTGGYFFPGYGYYGGGDSGDGGGDGGESRSGMAKGSQQISEYRDRLLQYVKSLLPNYPEYVLKDWLVPNKGNFSNLPDTDLKNGIMEKLKLAGLTPNTKWQLVPNMQFTMDMFEPMTKQRLIGRAGGSSDLGMGIPRDKERHATQAALAQQQGGVRKEPVLLIKTDKGYELLEGWHRTIQHFAKYPDGYIGPAYIAVAQPGVAEGSLNESAVFLNPTTVVVGQAHGQPLELSPDTLKKIQDIAAKHGAWYEGNGTDRSYTKGQIDRYVGSWDDEVAKTASPNDPKWLYVLFANVDENNRVKRVGVDPKDTIFNRLMDSAQDNSFQGIGYTARALQKFLQMASEDQYDFVKMSQQPATQENLTRFLKAGEALMWPSNWEQYPNRAGKIAKAATVDVRDQYLASRKAGVYVTGSGHLKAVQNITDQQGVAEGLTEYKNTPLQDYNGLQFMIDSNHPYLRVKAFAPGSGQQLAQVDFKIDDQDELHPEDLHVEERWRGQGIAQIMYDFVKSKGYTIHRSWSQTDAGAGFWDKHRGEERVWEQGVAENFADGRNPQDKGDAKRHGINTKASVSSLRKTAKQGGRKGQLAHWLANMKAGRAKNEDADSDYIEEKWSSEYKSSINCADPKGFSQKAHCAGRKK